MDKNLKEDKYLDYKKWGIRLQEEIFGKTFTTVGGVSMTETLLKKFKALNLKKGQKVLDIGCGTGGTGFFMAANHGVDVHGIEISSTMVAMANEYKCDRSICSTEMKHRIDFEKRELDEVIFKESHYDVIICRDVLMYYENKISILRHLKTALKPGGYILLTTLCRMEQDAYTEDFIQYAEDWDYFLVTVDDHQNLLENAGFGRAIALDETAKYIRALDDDLKTFVKNKDDILARGHYNANDFDILVRQWTEKLDRCRIRDQTWGVLFAKKLFD